MNHLLHSQSIFQETRKYHICQCLFYEKKFSSIKPYLSDAELLETIGYYSSFIDIWRQCSALLTKDIGTFDSNLLLCTHDGYVIDGINMNDSTERTKNLKLSLGINFFRLIADPQLSQWGHPTVSAPDICFHPLLPSLCPSEPLIAVISPFSEMDGPHRGAALIYITPYVTTTDILLVRAFRMSVIHTYTDAMNQKTTKFVRDALLSHLDCHMVFLNDNNEVAQEIHPIQLSASEIQEMHRMTQQEDCFASKHTIGNRTYQVDVIHSQDAIGPAVIGLFRDISRTEQYADRLRELEKFSSLATLSAGIAHEIRNPLTTARGFLQLFLKKSESPSDKQFLALTITELDRIQSLLRDFMNIAKPDLRDRQFVNLIDLVCEVVQFMRPEASLKNVELLCTTHAKTATIDADAGQIKQVFINILQNAVQACMHRGAVTVSTGTANGQVTIQFSDTGCGIENVSHLFHPFYTTKEAGTGLGLVVSKHIVEEHGGTIDVESTVDVGTTVRITLPLMKQFTPEF